MTPIKDHLQEMYAYVRWADFAMLDAAGTVSDEGFRREQNFSAGSVHKLLLHMLGAQFLWLGRWLGDSSRAFPTPEELPTLDSIRTRWTTLHEELMTFLDAQSEASLAKVVHYTRNGVAHANRLMDVMQHVADHDTYHRGQLNSLIKLAGGTPFYAGYIAYLRSKEGL